MATAFAGQAVDTRVARAAGSLAVPCQRVRMPQLAFSNSVRGNALVSRTAEVRAQRAAVRVQAAYPQAGGDNDEEGFERDEGFQERVIQVRRVTKVVKGGKQLSFRAVVRLTCLTCRGSMWLANTAQV